MDEITKSVVGATTQLANDAHDRLDTLEAHVASLAGFATLHTKLILAFLVVTILGLGTVFFGMHSFNTAMEKADAARVEADKRETNYEQEQKQVQSQLIVTNQQIAALTAAQSQRSQTIVLRDQRAAAEVQKVTTPNQTVPQVIDNMVHYGAVAIEEAQPTPDGNISVTPKAAEQITLTKIESDKCSADLNDTQANLKDETSKFDLSESKVDNLTKLNASCEEAKVGYKTEAEAYAKAAKKSKWRKVLDTAVKVGAFGMGVILGAAHI